MALSIKGFKIGTVQPLGSWRPLEEKVEPGRQGDPCCRLLVSGSLPPPHDHSGVGERRHPTLPPSLMHKFTATDTTFYLRFGGAGAQFQDEKGISIE